MLGNKTCKMTSADIPGKNLGSTEEVSFRSSTLNNNAENTGTVLSRKYFVMMPQTRLEFNLFAQKESLPSLSLSSSSKRTNRATSGDAKMRRSKSSNNKYSE